MATSRAMATVADLSSLLEARPDLMRELSELLDWSQIEVRELLGGEIEPQPDDLLIIGTFMLHQRRALSISPPPLLAA